MENLARIRNKIVLAQTVATQITGDIPLICVGNINPQLKTNQLIFRQRMVWTFRLNRLNNNFRGGELFRAVTDVSHLNTGHFPTPRRDLP